MAKNFLTDSFVRSAHVESGRLELWDSVVPGLGLRVSASKKAWFFVYHSPTLRDPSGGRLRRRLALGEYPELSLGAVRIRAAEHRERVARGEDPAAPAAPGQVDVAEPKGDVRLSDLMADYIERYAKRRKASWKTDRCVLLNQVLPGLGDRPASTVSVQQLTSFLEKRAETAPSLALRTHSIVRRLFHWGVRQWGLPANVARLVEPVHSERPRERVLTREEVCRIWQACEDELPRVGALLRLRLVTAQRGEQLARLQRAHLENCQEGGPEWWNVPSDLTKTRRPYRVYLSPLAREILAACPHHESGYLLAARHGGPAAFSMASPVIARVRRRSGTSGWQPRDLRRTAATWMAQRGVSRFIVKRVLGHADRDVTAVYDLYSYDAEVKAAVLVLEGAIRETIGR